MRHNVLYEACLSTLRRAHTDKKYQKIPASIKSVCVSMKIGVQDVRFKFNELGLMTFMLTFRLRLVRFGVSKLRICEVRVRVKGFAFRVSVNKVRVSVNKVWVRINEVSDNKVKVTKVSDNKVRVRVSEKSVKVIEVSVSELG